MMGARKIHLDPVAVLLLIASCGYEDMHCSKLLEDGDRKEYH
jgi:hypothetical protein